MNPLLPSITPIQRGRHLLKRSHDNLILLFVGLVSLALSLGAGAIGQRFSFEILAKIETYGMAIGGILLGSMLLSFLIHHGMHRGVKYFMRHWSIQSRLERQLIDARYYLERGNYLVLPIIKLTLSKNLKSGIIRIGNMIKFDKKLDDIDISAALGRYIVERHYLSDDANTHIYEITDSTISHRLGIPSIAAFRKHMAFVTPYTLFLDARSVIRLQSLLLCGMTGSGKTYALYSLVLQLLNSDFECVIYFCDPKGSSLAVLGAIVDKARTAIKLTEIISMLERFVSDMQLRKEELAERLKTKLDADYSTFGLTPNIMIIDEYATFATLLAAEDKKTRDRVKSLIYEIVLEGRQLGFFLFIVMQKSDATLIDTALRDNLPLKIVLGNAEQQTYVTAFGTGVDIPNRNYGQGEGVFTEPSIAPQPKLVQFPTLEFDILDAVNQSGGDVMTPAPENESR